SFNRAERFFVVCNRLFPQRQRLLRVFFLCCLQPQTSSQPSLCGPHQIETLVFLRTFLRVVVEFRSVFELSLSQRNIAETRSRRGAETSHLSEFRNAGDRAAGCLQCIIEM